MQPAGWVVAVALLAAVVGGLAWAWWQAVRELARLRVDLAHERASHYRTWRALESRQRLIGRLEVHVQSLREIAAASSMGAQLYQAMMGELRGPAADGNPPSESSHTPHTA